MRKDDHLTDGHHRKLANISAQRFFGLVCHHSPIRRFNSDNDAPVAASGDCNASEEAVHHAKCIICGIAVPNRDEKSNFLRYDANQHTLLFSWLASCVNQRANPRIAA
jgi:hypothetical protein